MTMRRSWLAAAVLLCWLATVGAAVRAEQAGLDFSPMTEVGGGRVSAVPDGETLVLDDGRFVKLAAIQSPRRPPELPPAALWPLEQAARAALAELVAGRRLTLFVGAAGPGGPDRYDRLVAQLRRDDGVWVQGALLERGLARVATTVDARDGAAALYAAEQVARQAGLGMWRHKAYRLRDPGDVGQAVGRFAVVRGAVVSAREVRGRVYLNFGEDWRRDFTARADKAAVRLFGAAGVSLTALEGLTVEVRGWVHRRNGPMIDLTHPEQLVMVAGAGGS